MTSTIERARNRWREILPQFGIEARFLQNRGGPCPLCGGKDRYRFDDRDGSGSYFCNQCGPGPGLMLIRKFKSWDHATACAAVDQIIGRGPAPAKSPATDEVKERARRKAEIERRLGEATDTRVLEAFLRKRRLVITSPALRGHPACPYFEEGKLVGRFPAVIAPILAADGTLESAALMYGVVAPEPRKKFMPVINTINGAAVRLFDPDQGRIGVAEGIATALAARQLFGVPTWAALSAGGMKTFAPPSGVQRVTIFADADANHVGPAAAYDLAHRLTRAGITADVQMPHAVGTDFADLLPEQKEHS